MKLKAGAIGLTVGCVAGHKLKYEKVVSGIFFTQFIAVNDSLLHRS